MQQSPTFLGPRTGFVGDSFSTWRGGGWFGDDSSTLHLLYTFITVITSAPPESIRLGIPEL